MNSNNPKEIRWHQRMQNLNKAYLLLSEVARLYPDLSDLEKEGMVQRFEYTFELAWKTLKDYLESKGIPEKFPRDIIKKSFETGLVEDGESWMEMLENRNLLSHTYDEKVFAIVIEKVAGKYYNLIAQLVSLLNKQL